MWQETHQNFNQLQLFIFCFKILLFYDHKSKQPESSRETPVE